LVYFPPFWYNFITKNLATLLNTRLAFTLPSVPAVSYGCNGGNAVTANGTYFSSDNVASGTSGQCQLKYCAGKSCNVFGFKMELL
jgi:hypothetical protein